MFRVTRRIIAPAYTGRLATSPVPALRLPDESMEPQSAYRFIHDELMLDGSSRLNLATFVTTWMDPEADDLMVGDVRQEHDRQGRVPRHRGHRAALRVHGRRPVPRRGPARRRPVHRYRGVHHRIQRGGHAGRAGDEVALARRRSATDAKTGWKTRTPNLVMGSNVQVVWEKFCRYFDVEAALPADGGGPLRHHARAGARARRRGHHRGGRHPGHHLHR